VALSAIVRDGADADAVAGRLQQRAPRHRARVDTAESESRASIDWLAAQFGAGTTCTWKWRPPAVAGSNGCARPACQGPHRRCHGRRVPTPAALAAPRRCGKASTRPATHAVRGAYRLTYEPGAAAAPMYGYLNVLLATAALRAGRPAATAEALLQMTDAATLEFTADAVRWGADRFPLSMLRDTRSHHLVSFGSCSFQEPVDEFDALASR
jgi:hypothetical protein